MEISGVCNICFDNLSAEKRGVQCSKCFRCFHCSCSKVESKITRHTKWCCVQCKESNAILELLNTQKTEISKLMEITNRVETLSEDLANLKVEIPNMIKTEVNSVLSNTNESFKSNYSETKKDILISGLPASITNSHELSNIIIKACSILGVDININNIYNCYWLGDKKNVIVKFNSLLVRDSIMKKYLEKKNLLVSQILQGYDCSSRVYFNNNYPFNILKMLLYSRKLKKLNIILDFKMDFKSFLYFNRIDCCKLLSEASLFDLRSIYATNDVNIQLQLINDCLTSLIISNVPVSVRKPSNRCNFPFMNSQEVLLSKNLRDLAFHRYKSNASSVNWNSYCKLRNKTSKLTQITHFF